MNQRIIALILGIGALLLVTVLWVGLQIDQKSIPNTLVGKKAYPLAAEWIQGQSLLTGPSDALTQAQNRVLVLNFWASWCVSCREEARELELFWQQYKDKDVLVLGVAIQDQTESAARFAAEFGKTYLLGLDTSGKISIDYGVTGVPESFIIDRQGIVVHKHVGPVSATDLAKLVDPLLP
jgi:cytochrome c biogenesis protein CcmG/thiol:disulfide interchange protein DsbE